MERRVRERTTALDARNGEMRMVLDNVSQGLVIAGRDGRLLAERSAILSDWFCGSALETLDDLVAGDAPARQRLDAGWQQLLDNFVPIEVAIEQLPQELRLVERIYSIAWEPIVDAGGELERMLVVLSDVTEARRRQEAEREQKELIAFFDRLSHDRKGVVSFIKEAAAAVAELA